MKYYIFSESKGNETELLHIMIEMTSLFNYGKHSHYSKNSYLSNSKNKVKIGIRKALCGKRGGYYVNLPKLSNFKWICSDCNYKICKDCLKEIDNLKQEIDNLEIALVNNKIVNFGK